MIFILLVCIALGSISILRARVASRRHAIETIENLGGSIEYDFQDSSMVASPSDFAAEVGRALGDEMALSDVKLVTFLGEAGSRFGDEELTVLQHFQELRCLNLSNTRISDKGLGRLTEFRQLEELWFTGRPFTMEGVNQLRPVICRLKYLGIDASTSDDVREEITELLKPGAELLIHGNSQNTIAK